MNNGWIKLHRKLKDHWLYTENREFSKLEAWIDILMEVNHAPHKVAIGNLLLDISSGESLNSLDTWAKRWNWNKSKVRRFLNLLQSDNMIALKSETKTTRLTVCNYDSYQVERNADETQVKRKRHASDTQATPNKKDKKDNNEKNNQEGLEPAAKKTFSKPSIEECLAYAKEKGYTWDVEHFWNHHESKGWMVGKNKMKSWQSAMVTWDKNDKKFNKKQTDQPTTLHEWIQRGGTVAGFREYEQKNRQP